MKEKNKGLEKTTGICCDTANMKTKEIKNRMLRELNKTEQDILEEEVSGGGNGVGCSCTIKEN